MKNTNKKGISLIVLVITIIVMLVLASAIIITLSNTNIIIKAKEAVLKTDVKNFEQELSVSLAEEKIENKNLDINKITQTDLEEIKKYIPSFDEKYAGKIFIQNGEVVYDETKVTEDEKTALEAIGIKSGKIYTPAEIKAIIEAKNLGTDISTTDITPYVEGLSKSDAAKYTIFRGDLYYRYERTTYEEQLELYAAEISILMGDANEDGILTAEDADIIVALYRDYEMPEIYTNFMYICDFAADFVVDEADEYPIRSISSGTGTVLSWVSIEKQNPARIKFTGDYTKIYSLWLCGETPTPPTNINTTEYSVMKEYYPDMTEEMSKKVQIVDGELMYIEDKLTEEEKMWVDGAQIPCV